MSDLLVELRAERAKHEVVPWAEPVAAFEQFTDADTGERLYRACEPRPRCSCGLVDCPMARALDCAIVLAEAMERATGYGWSVDGKEFFGLASLAAAAAAWEGGQDAEK